MHRLLRLLGILLIAGSMLPGTAIATAIPAASGCNQAPPTLSAPAKPQATTTNVNLRQGPGLACSIVMVVDTGTPVDQRSSAVTANGHQWVDVSVGNIQGWLATDYLGPVSAPHKVPVLMYHHISSAASRYYVTPDELDQQLRWLRNNGYVTVTPSDLAAALFQGKALPPRPVMITMDDGNPSSLVLEQHLTEFGFRGTYFLPNYAEQSMTDDQMRMLDKSGETCGHTVTHPFLNQESDAAQTWEITTNKAWLEKIVGHPVICFAYPFGVYGPDTAQLLAAAGYQLAFNAWGGPLQLRSYDRWHIPRMEVDGGLPFNVFIAEMNRES